MAYNIEKFLDDATFFFLIAFITLFALMLAVVIVMFALAAWG